MKKAYNQTWIENSYIRFVASTWRSKNLLSEEQEENTKSSFPDPMYRPGLFVKIGLFFFGCIACAFFSGLVSIFFIDAGSNVTFSALSIVCCICFLIALEFLIKDRKLFHSGVDNALLYAAITAAMIPAFMLFENAEPWFFCIISLAILLPVTLRYADLLTTVLCYISLVSLLGIFMMKSEIGKSLLPFSVMMLSLTIYFLARKNKDIYYADCQKILEVLALVTFYLGGNYFVVREGNAWITDFALGTSPEIAFSPLFYFFTTVIPILYVIIGLRNNNRILFVVGLVTLAFSIYTYHHYFSFLTIAQQLALGGAVLITVSAGIIRYLKTPKHGISDEQEGKRKLANLEAVLVAQTFGPTTPAGSVELGGGNFGGGGAGEAY